MDFFYVVVCVIALWVAFPRFASEQQMLKSWTAVRSVDGGGAALFFSPLRTTIPCRWGKDELAPGRCEADTRHNDRRALRRSYKRRPPKEKLTIRLSNPEEKISNTTFTLTTHQPKILKMAPINNATYENMLGQVDQQPMSRTHQYRKVMKPLLERKRRARINKCLDELKDLMVYAVQSEGEAIAKLEKADVLELTVRHLQKLKRQQMLQANPALDMDRFRAGFTSCATEVSRCLASIPGVNIAIGTTLMSHLGTSINSMDNNRVSSPLTVNTAPSMDKHRSFSPSSSDGGYNSGRESTPSPVSVGVPSPPPVQVKQEQAVWRPF